MVERFADGLAHPRSMLRLGNGDILVAETGSPKREVGGITGIVMNFLMGKAGADAPSPNRIILLRDSNRDGKADERPVLLEGLNSPYVLAMVGDTLYVANKAALVAYHGRASCG